MSQDYAAIFAEVSDDDFPMVMRQQLEVTNLEDLPEALRTVLLERARKLGINMGNPWVSSNP